MPDPCPSASPDRRRRPRPGRGGLGALALALAASGALAQSPRGLALPPSDTPVALVADEVAFDETTQVVTARGAVEVFYGARTLTAEEIVYDARSGRIRATGGMVLRSEEGTTLFADAADLDADLRDGLIEGARALIGQGGAIAAVEARRIDGRYNSLSKAVFSTCEVCGAAPTPLWAVRARRIVHDEQERTIHYEDAVIEVAGVPVAWLPFFSHPDPTVTRKSGFLAPEFSQSSLYGLAVKVPYFFELGPSRDLTVTPFPTTKDGPILELGYRQRFDGGRLDLEGSGGALDTADDGGTEFRGHLFGSGLFSAATLGLGEGAVAGFGVAAASDDGYLKRYDFGSQDRLESEAFVEDYGATGFFRVAGAFFQSLRETEDQGSIPIMLPEFTVRERMADPFGYGEIGLESSGVYLTREEGRDVGRLSLEADWERREILPAGFVGRAFAQGRFDLYHVSDDPDFKDGFTGRLAPHVGAELFYPLVADGPFGGHLIEPGAQLVVAPTDVNDDDIPNEDSLIVEFDETNLFDVDRFPGRDQVEEGTRVNLGMRYARMADDPLRLDASFGRVFRLSEESAFSEGTGLSAQDSDYVVAWGVGWGPNLDFTNRLRLSESFGVNRNEMAARVAWGPARLRGSYVTLERDATAGADEDRTEAAIGAELDLTDNWTIGGFGRRDLQNDGMVRTSGGIAYRTDCAAIELYAGRDFTDTADAPAATTFGLRVRVLGGGGTGGARGRSALCAPDRSDPDEAPDLWSDTFLSRSAWR
jgi:LPS-assembly protein